MGSREKQRQVERLLDRIRNEVVEADRLRVRGVGGRALAEVEHELALDRTRLARVVAQPGDDEPRTTSSTGMTVLGSTASGRSTSSTARSAAASPIS
jgi:hypothetical protein